MGRKEKVWKKVNAEKGGREQIEAMRSEREEQSKAITKSFSRQQPVRQRYLVLVLVRENGWNDVDQEAKIICLNNELVSTSRSRGRR